MATIFSLEHDGRDSRMPTRFEICEQVKLLPGAGNNKGGMWIRAESRARRECGLRKSLSWRFDWKKKRGMSVTSAECRVLP
jgi:hypothetical protein